MRPNGRVATLLVALVVAGALGPVGTATAQDSSCSFPVTVTDATGTAVTVEQRPERVVTLAPSAAQTMWEIGGRDQVVGVSQYASYLDGAGDLPVVAGRDGVDVETVLDLEPDLVLVPDIIDAEDVRRLREAGVTVYSFEAATSIDAVAAQTRRTGRLTGNCEGASETVGWMNRNVDAVRRAVDDEPRPRALYVFFGYTAGKDTFIHTMLEVAGAENLAARYDITGYRQVSEEVVVEGDPQWLVLNSDSPQVPDSAAYNGTTAVRQNNTVVVNYNYVSQPAPRSVVYTVRNLTEAIHPDAYREAMSALDETETTTASDSANTTTETTGGTDGETTETTDGTDDATTAADGTTDGETTETTDGTDDETTETGGQPGFGAAAAVATLLGAAALAARFG